MLHCSSAAGKKAAGLQGSAVQEAQGHGAACSQVWDSAIHEKEFMS